MGDTGVRTLSYRSRFLQISSIHDIHADSKLHNPADFEVSMPNSVVSNDIIRIVPHTVSVPRMFPTVYAPSNRFTIWRRKTKVIQTGLNQWFITGEPEWIPFHYTVRPARYTLQTLSDEINAMTGAHMNLVPNVDTGKLEIYGQLNVWQYWGRLDYPETPPEPPTYMPYMFVTEPDDSHFFDVLGLGLAQFVPTSTSWLSYIFDPANPSSGDSIRGSPIEQARLIIPFFDTANHDIGNTYFTTWQIPELNPPNLEGPLWVNVIVDELGDNTTIDTETGKPISIVACIPLCDAKQGSYYTRTVRDCDAEAIQFNTERSVRSFRVRCEDVDGTKLTLPRNWPVLLRLQILQTQ